MMDQMMFAPRAATTEPSTDVNAPMNLFDGDDVYLKAIKIPGLIRNFSRTSARNVMTRPFGSPR